MGSAFYQDLEVAGPWGSAVATATALRTGFAPGYNTMSLVLFDSSIGPGGLRRQQVTVKLTVGGATRVLFVGRIAAAKRLLRSQGNEVYCEVDGEESTADVDIVNSPRASDAATLGWHCVFNEGGRPNCHPTNSEFYDGKDAVFWTAAKAVKRLRTYMVRSSWSLADATIDAVSDLNRAIKPYDARGERVLKAICEVLQRAGCRMTFRYASGTCVPVIVGPSGSGTFGIDLRPDLETDRESYELSVGFDDRKTTPVMYAMSGQYRQETTYSSKGTRPLLVGSTSTDNEYAWQYAIQVQNYDAHSLGESLASGSVPLKIEHELVSRRSGLGTYHTPAEVTAEPLVGAAVDVRETVAIYDTTSASWLRLVGGIRLWLDAKDGVVLRLKASVSVAAESGKTRKIDVSAACPDVRFTGSTVIRANRVVSATSLAQDTSTDSDAALNFPQIIPSRRYNSTLPGSSINTWVSVNPTAIAIYRDVDDLLAAMLAGPYQQRARNVNVVDCYLPFVPDEVPIGAVLEVAGDTSELGLSGHEIITAASWDLGDVDVRIQASDAVDLVQDGLYSADMKRIVQTVKRARRAQTA